MVRANLLEELDASQTLQSASAGPAPSAGPVPPEPAQLNTAEGLKSTSGNIFINIYFGLYSSYKILQASAQKMNS